MGDPAVLRLIVVHAHLISQRRSLKGIVIKIRPAACECHYAQERAQATSHSPPHLIRTPSLKIDHGPVKATAPGLDSSYAAPRSFHAQVNAGKSPKRTTSMGLSALRRS